MTRLLRVAIVDDEPPALRRLQLALAREPDVEVAAIASDGASALQIVGHGGIDVVLLDIRMPGLSGLDLARMINPSKAPAVIFVTAFSRFAVDAFDLEAVDYLLKPVRFERLREALERARRSLDLREQAAHPSAAPSQVSVREAVVSGDGSAYLSAIWAPDRGDRVRIPLEQVDWIEAERDYARIHGPSRSFLIRRTMRSLSAELDPAQFIAVRRGALVRRDRVVRLARRAGGLFAVVLRSGAEVIVARRHAAEVRRRLAEEQARP